MSIIKDPIYGYVEIDKEILHGIIDKAEFQRLRNIRQTSYAPLYPAALHNRFVHSIGVYYLGKLAFEALYSSMREHKEKGTAILGDLVELFGDSLESFKELFVLACLMHDIGHSPFSHTGEEFYKNSISKKALKSGNEYTYKEHLCELTGDEVFVSPAVENAAPHEIMSCIVALEAFGNNTHYFKDDKERSFFARCITGLKYTDATGLSNDDFLKMTEDRHNEIKKEMLLNCLIHLLHSSVIDVDRLDYIIRDSITIGYQNVSVDYKRLLSGIVLVMDGDYNFTIGYNKNAISIIENVVYAHDNEKRWVQGHPAILYDSYLLRKAIIEIEERIKEDNPNVKSTFFGFDSLSNEGSEFRTGVIRYLCDSDLIYYMKNVYRSKCSEEYFHRDARRFPAWKSEAEFNQLFNESERILLKKAMGTILAGSSSDADGVEVSDQTLSAIDEEIRIAREESRSNLVKAHENKKRYFSSLLDVCERNGAKRNILLLSTKFFKSNFSKDEIQNLIISFESGYAKLGQISTTLSRNPPSQDTLIYLFYYPLEGRTKINIKELSEALVTEFKKIQS